MAIDDSQLTMDQILSGEPVKVPEAAPEPEPVEVAREEQTEQVETPTPQATEQQAQPQTPEQDSAETAPQEGDLPPWLDPEKDPEGASNWRALRESAKDFKRQAAEKAAAEAEVRAELEALKRQIEQARIEAQRPPPPKLPPVEENPEAHIAALRAEMAQDRMSRTFDRSEFNAVTTHGKEKVDKAFERFKGLPENDPMRVQMTASEDPWGFIVSEFDRRDLLSEIGTDPSQYRERVAAEVRAQVEAELAAKAKAEAEAGVEKSIRERLPTSMANVASGAGQNSSTREDNWNGPAPMGEVIGGGLDRYS